MKISLNWLKSYIETSLPAEEIAKILTDIGLEVEGLEQIETVRGGLSGLVVGEVLTCEKHPDADKLHVTTVDLGDGAPTQIVCGAPNVAAGQKVVVATINTMLYPTGEAEGFKIKKSKIRGVESLGMLCAEDEIGIGTSHDGIIVLPNDVPGRHSGPGLLPDRRRLPARNRIDAQPRRCDVALWRGARPGRIPAGERHSPPTRTS